MKRILLKIADYRKADSLAARARLKRTAFFKDLISSMRKPVRILDLGGTELFWEKAGFAGNEDYQITLLNTEKIESHYINIKSILGDARYMPELEEHEIDVIFSNSVIEHVGAHDAQMHMANEIRRLGKRYFIQTPNFYFFFEPHFLFPFFQFLPLWLKVILLRRFNLGWHKRAENRDDAVRTVASIRLLKKSELRELFPGAAIHKEKYLGMTKSFVIYHGW